MNEPCDTDRGTAHRRAGSPSTDRHAIAPHVELVNPVVSVDPAAPASAALAASAPGASDRSPLFTLALGPGLVGLMCLTTWVLRFAARRARCGDRLGLGFPYGHPGRKFGLIEITFTHGEGEGGQPSARHP